MIEDWRQAWGIGPFPFYFVQLANFQSGGWWPVLRESQTDALNLINTGMASAIDIGMSKDIHPTNKQEVGRRLSLAARDQVYGEKLEWLGPLYRTVTFEGNKARVWFDHLGKGLDVHGGGVITGFEIADQAGKYVPAEAKIEGNTVLVWSANIAEPAAVRYAWADDPQCNLINKDNLPANPFRTKVVPVEK
jgi:sialate O-acetylesterase